jgi:hypothetical protein
MPTPREVHGRKAQVKDCLQLHIPVHLALEGNCSSAPCMLSSQRANVNSAMLDSRTRTPVYTWDARIRAAKSPLLSSFWATGDVSPNAR